MTITVASFGGHALDSGDYRAHLMPDAFQRTGEHVTVKPPGSWPRSVRVELRERSFELQVKLQPGVDIQDAHEELAGWFATGTEADLVVDFDGTDRTLTCVVIAARPFYPYTGVFTALLEAVDARWKHTSLQTVTTPVTASGQTFALVNDGTATVDDAVITVTPTTAKSVANGWRYAREVIVAWRATRASAGPYPLEITEGWDHAAEVSAGRSLATGDDVRVLVDGVEVPRWWGSHADTDPNSPAARLWIAQAFSPRRTFTLLAAATAGSPADDGELEVEKGGTLGWPSSGAFVLDDEVFTYSGRTESNANGRAAFTGITRGARTSTAATHSAGTTGYWLEHRIQIVYGYTSATAPDARADLEPMLDRSNANLSNTRWVWADFLDSRYPGRAAQWQRVYQARDTQSALILSPSGAPAASLAMEYQSDGQQAGKPAFNVWRMPIPCGTPTSSTLLSGTYGIEKTLAARFLGIDDDGNEFALQETRGPVTAASALSIAAPTRAIFDLLIQGRSQVTLDVPDGVRQNNIAIDSSPSYTTAGSQQFTAEVDGYVYGAMIYVNHAGNLSAVSLWTDSSNAPGERMSDEASVLGLGAGSWGTVAFATPVPVYAGQKFWLRAFSNSAGCTWRGYYGTYGGGISGTAGVVLRSRILTLDAVSEDLARGDDGEQVTLDSPDLRLDSAGVPYVNALARADRYWFRGATIENTSTAQVITFSALCSLNDSIEIDVAAATARNVTTGEPIAGGALEFSDPAGRLELTPGSNTLEFTEAGLVAVTVDVDYRSRWQ